MFSPELVKADSGWAELAPEVVLIEACAVFTEMEDVGGPDTKIDLGGGGLVWLSIEGKSFVLVTSSCGIVRLRVRTLCVDVDLVDDAAGGNGSGERLLEPMGLVIEGTLLSRCKRDLVASPPIGAPIPLKRS